MSVREAVRREATQRWALYAVLIATVVAYASSFTSPLYADDYIYLLAAREWSFPEFTRVAFTPWGNEPTFTFTRDYWRPLAFMWFELAEPSFGDDPLPYHLVNMAVHLASTILVWKLASRLDPRPAVRMVAATVFALYPGSYDAVTWISSVNSAGLTFALGAWLVFLRATGDETFRWDLTALSAGLVGVGLMFRETSTALLPAMGLWYFLVQRRDRLLEWRVYLPLLPFVSVGVVYALIRTRLLTEPLANPDIYKFDDQTLHRWWFYVENALVPFRYGATGWKERLQDVSGWVLLAIPVLALIRRRWDIVALSAGLLLSIVPYGATVLGIGQRYFYFSTPPLALLLGIFAAELSSVAARRAPWLRTGTRVAWAEAAGVLILAVAGAAVTFDRIDNWSAGGPEQHERWIDGLRAQYPALPDGSTVYCSNVPLILTLFGGVMIEPTVRWYYPHVGHAVLYSQAQAPPLGPDDRWYAATATP